MTRAIFKTLPLLLILTFCEGIGEKLIGNPKPEPEVPESSVEKNGKLTFLEAFSTGAIPGSTNISGLRDPFNVVVSSDDKNVYVTCDLDDSLVVFNRDVATGALTFNELFDDHTAQGVGSGTDIDGLDGATGLAISPDGKNVYVGSREDKSLLVFTRNTSNGKLTLLEVFQDHAAHTDPDIGTNQDGLDIVDEIAVSPDGKSVYTGSYTDHTLLVFDRNSTTGALTFREAFQDHLGNADPDIGTNREGLQRIDGIIVSNDNKNVYTVSSFDDTLIVFDRNTSTGALTYNQAFQDHIGHTGAPDFGTNVDGLESAAHIAISPDDKTIYIVAGHSVKDNALVVFDRNTADGTLTFQKVFQDHAPTLDPDLGTNLDGLDEPVKVIVSPDGLSVYIASQDDVNILHMKRDTSTGAVELDQVLQDFAQHADPDFGTNQVGLRDVRGLALSADGNTLYAVAKIDDALLVFRRD